MPRDEVTDDARSSQRVAEIYAGIAGYRPVQPGYWIDGDPGTVADALDELARGGRNMVFVADGGGVSF